MKKLLILIASAFLFTINLNAQDIKNVNVTEFEKLVSQLDDTEVLLDVRSKSEVKEGYIKGMTNIDFYDPEFDAEVAKLDKSKTYYVYCAAGGRSYKAAKKMSGAGIKNVYNLNGGIIAWNKEKKPVEK